MVKCSPGVAKVESTSLWTEQQLQNTLIHTSVMMVVY